MIPDPSIWSKLHGASTHFPIALMLVSAFCESLGLLNHDPDRAYGLRFTATLTLVLGALGSYGAVVSGLIMSKWEFMGNATLRMHHLFVWPAFALMTGLATWRIITGSRISQKPPVAYLALMFLAALLMGGAGYWGGELLNQG